MMVTTQTPVAMVETPTVPAPSGSSVRKTRCNVAGTSVLWSGPQANPQRIRLTSPGNPVHR
jgi:hypothetical protein